MKLFIRGIVFAMCLVLSAVTVGAEENDDRVRAAIDRNNANLSQAVIDGDLDAVLNTYLEEGILMPPNSPVIAGHDGLRLFWKFAIDAGMQVTPMAKNVEVHGDTAIETGEYKTLIRNGDGSTIEDTGKYVVIWKRVGEEWKIDVDIWNSNG